MMHYENGSEYEKRRQNELVEHKIRSHSKYSLQHLFRRQAEEILSYVNPTDSILDVGCGIGDLIVLAAKHTKGIVVGIDISDRSVETAQRRLEDSCDNAKAITANIEGSGEKLKQLGTFDRVLLKGVIHHLAKPQLAFKNIFDLLSLSGSLIVLEGNVSSGYRRLMLAIADSLNIEHEASQYPHIPPDKIVLMLRDVGFKQLQLNYVPGIFAPFAFVGFGGTFFWKIAKYLESLGHLMAASFFGWWVLIEATKIDPLLRRK
jgi:2-polyprenyl-3-methyl-5-hydroxy-6-metoxy-1,4-benzoquinol methylase